MHRNLSLLAGLLFASAAQAQPASEAARQFGVRESVEQIDISPDGRRIVYLEPGPGRTTRVYVADLDGGGTPHEVTSSDGAPARLRWCNFATNDRLVCRVHLMNQLDGQLVPFSRLLSLDLDGSHVVGLGQSD